MIAWLYAAVSSERQAEDLAAQEVWARGVCDREGWDLSRIFSKPGTGKHGPRKLLLSLISELQHAPVKPDVVLMNRLDRIGRGKVSDSQVALAQITDLGVRVFTREQGFVANDSWVDELINAVRFAVARQENDAKADRARAGHETKRQEGKHAGHAPYGTILIDGRPIPYEPEAAIIREVFAKRLEGWGVHRIARTILRTAPPKKKSDGTTRPMRWSPSTVWRMLESTTYRGSVVSEETWDNAQAVNKTEVPLNRAVQRWPWPLRGAVRCTCGMMLTTYCSGAKRCRIRYYACNNIQHEKYIYHRADRLEAQFKQILIEARADPELVFASKGPDTEPLEQERLALEREKTSLETRRQKVWGLFESDAIPDHDLKRRLGELQAERDRIDARLQELSRTLMLERNRQAGITSATQVLAKLVDVWERVPVEQQRDVAKAVAFYARGLWCDPNDVGVLRYGPFEGSIGKCEQLLTFPSAANFGRSLLLGQRGEAFGEHFDGLRKLGLALLERGDLVAEARHD